MTAAEETREVIKAAKAASIIANREAKALDLVVRVIQRGIIFDKYPDGRKIRVGQVTPAAFSKFKKGMVLHLKNE